METVIGGLCALSILGAVMFSVFGEQLFEALPSIKRYNRLAQSLGKTNVHGARFGRGAIEVRKAASKPLFDLADPDGPEVGNFGTRPFGDVMEVVHVRVRRHARLVHELRGYCAVLVFLFLGALFNAARAGHFKPSVPELFTEIGAKPLEYLGSLELFMIFLLVFRLSMELLDLNLVIKDAPRSNK